VRTSTCRRRSRGYRLDTPFAVASITSAPARIIGVFGPGQANVAKLLRPPARLRVSGKSIKLRLYARPAQCAPSARRLAGNWRSIVSCGCLPAPSASVAISFSAGWYTADARSLTQLKRPRLVGREHRVVNAHGNRMTSLDCSCTHQIQRRSRHLVLPLRPHRVDAGRGEGAVNLEQCRYDASLFGREAEARPSVVRRQLSVVTDQLQRLFIG
jgi:hypothetical protein